MCGICGVYSFDGRVISPEPVAAMTSTLAHRGPDGSATYVSGRIGLGHRRLSIIDLAGGTQPISNEDGRLQVIFNGEIYNFIEIRSELERCGHVFKTKSDTEVIVHAYEQWGTSCVDRFNGIFAFALWDSSAQSLFLARDRFGVKPLYYAYLPTGDFIFGSEIKALLRHSPSLAEMDIRSFSLLFTLRYVPSPNTLFRTIKKLPPAHLMIVRPDGVHFRRYWNWTPQIRTGWDERALVEEYRELVKDAVRLQMRSDVPVGLFLSSGIDSGALLALMSQYSPLPVQTFTIGFEDGEATNETADAREMARRFGAEHEEMTISAADYERYYERYMLDLEEPVGNETAAAFYFVSLLASRKVKVALTGQGADEPWAGYPRHLGAKLSSFYSRMPAFLTERVSRLVTKFVRNERIRRGALSLSEADALTRLVRIYSFYSPEMKRSLFQPWLKELISTDGEEAIMALRDWHSDVRHCDPLTQILYMDSRTNLPDDLLMVGDKTSMANSLEARVPFLDHRLVEFVETLPPSLRLRGLQAKYLHKKAIEAWLPREIVYRKKKGFENPIQHWLRGGMRGFVRDILLDRNSAVLQYCNRSYIEQLIDAHANGIQEHMRHIYLLISFELWHGQFIKSTQFANDQVPELIAARS